jgi:hypothetical protein
MAKNPCFVCIPWIQAGNDLKGDGRNGPVNHGKVVVDPLRIRRIHFPNWKEVPPCLFSQPGICPSPGDENRRTALILRRKKGWEQIRQSVFSDKYPTLPIVECRFFNACWIWPFPGDENRRTALILRREKGGEHIRTSAFSDKCPTLPNVECRFFNACYVCLIGVVMTLSPSFSRWRGTSAFEVHPLRVQNSITGIHFAYLRA